MRKSSSKWSSSTTIDSRIHNNWPPTSWEVFLNSAPWDCVPPAPKTDKCRPLWRVRCIKWISSRRGYKAPQRKPQAHAIKYGRRENHRGRYIIKSCWCRLWWHIMASAPCRVLKIKQRGPDTVRREETDEMWTLLCGRWTFPSSQCYGDIKT